MSCHDVLNAMARSRLTLHCNKILIKLFPNNYSKIYITINYQNI